MYTEGLPFTGDALQRGALGGSETAFISVARELAALGHDVTAYCICPSEGIYDGVRYRHRSRLGEAAAVEHDLFLCSRYFGALAVDVPARTRFLWMHDVLMPDAAAALAPLLPRIDLAYCVSEYHRGLVARALPPLVPRLSTTFNGVDLTLTGAVVGAPKRHRIMFTSRPERGLLRALHLYEALGDRALELLVCSYPSLPDPDVRAVEDACASRIEGLRRLGFPIRTDRFPKADLYRHLAASKAVLYPTDFPEVFCISALEAQACGTAFITTDAFALPETMAYRGLPPGDDDAFLDRLRQVLTDADLRRDLETRGLAHAAGYGWRGVAERFAGDVARRLGAPPPRARPEAMDRVGARPFATAMPRRRWAPRGGKPGSAAMAADAFDATRPAAPARTSAWVVATPARPMVSCLTATRGNRLVLLKRAVDCYLAQTWPARELVVVSEATGRRLAALEAYIRSLGRADVRLVTLASGAYTLGSVRNASLDAARGDVVCQWDDDDLYHPLRLEAQLAPLLEQGEGAAFLTDQLQLMPDGTLHWVDWTGGGRVQGIWRLIPGTLAMFADARFRYPEEGPRSVRGEDSSLLEAMLGHVPIRAVSGLGHLYVYTWHGRNTFGRDHHQGQANRSATADFLRPRMDLLREALRHYPLPRPVTVMGGGEVVLRVAG